MAKKKIDIHVTDGGMFTDYYAVARDSSGNKVADAYGKNRQEAIAKVVQKVRTLYGSEAEILY